METDLHVTVTAKDREIVGETDPGTRMYRQSGSQEGSRRWYEYISDRWGPLVSPGGAAMYVQVSRAGIHKRLKSGKMTAFLFHVTGRERTFSGKERTVKSQPYVYIPVIECKVWATEVAMRSMDAENLSEDEFNALCDEIDGSKKDWDQDFVDRDPKDRGKKDVRSELDLTVRETIELLIDLWKSKPWKKEEPLDRLALFKLMKKKKEEGGKK